MSRAMEIAATMLGRGEIPNRAAIQDYLKTGGANLDPATTAWCAAFVNSSLGQAGIKGTGSNLARSFLNFGQPVDQPQKGDIAVFSRGDNPTFGHVGFFDSLTPDGKVRILAGNQGNSVSFGEMDPSQLLGYRRAGQDGATPSAAPAGGTALASNFVPEGFDMASLQPSLGDSLVQGMSMIGQQRQSKRSEAERARKEALFGQGGVADMFA
jgi:uncharacterized protein (TIGR02594 family)